MLDFFLSKVKGLFSAPSDTSKTSKKEKNISKNVSKDEVKPIVSQDNEEKNRVVFSPTKATPPVVVVDTSKLEAQVEASLQNAKKIEAETKVKEAEVFRRLSSLDEKERYLIQKEKSIDQQSLDVKKKLDSVDDLYRKQLDKLEAISGLDIEKAKKLVISSTEKKMVSWIAKKIEEAKDEIRQKEEEITKEIIVDNIRHGLTDYVAEFHLWLLLFFWQSS